jgi:hypothetical protein
MHQTLGPVLLLKLGDGESCIACIIILHFNYLYKESAASCPLDLLKVEVVSQMSTRLLSPISLLSLKHV